MTEVCQNSQTDQQGPPETLQKQAPEKDVQLEEQSVQDGAGVSTWFKLLSLLALVVQNSSVILIMKFASSTAANDGRFALGTSVVCMVPQHSTETTRESDSADLCKLLTPVSQTELVKVLMCVIEIFVRRHGILRGMQEIREEILQQPRATLLLCLPSMLYVAQNNIMWIA
eukprot:CAMPEP_0184311572 /NCGR_PEP_ID=MMETSP1049-20130417/42702_1 /TAXON_ID=77928 /ORGANISM="Proteomonas sulcata, Strain CCMP704" /LENGTH=170 /DNA_ID=CAMNT_0026627071 /DNA_START=74 /DNA_END=583 /DNA_ORIENTATION=+